MTEEEKVKYGFVKLSAKDLHLLGMRRVNGLLQRTYCEKPVKWERRRSYQRGSLL